MLFAPLSPALMRETVAFPTCDGAAHLTGQVIAVNGGVYVD